MICPYCKGEMVLQKEKVYFEGVIEEVESYHCPNKCPY